MNRSIGGWGHGGHEDSDQINLAHMATLIKKESK